LITTKITQIETSTVHKNKIYNGVHISAEDGFVSERSDKKAKTIMNATEGISIYSDLGDGLERNFFVGIDGRIKGKGIDIDGSGTFEGTIRANQLLIGGENGTISFQDLSDQPFIPDNSYITTITENTITTAYVNALEVKAGSVDAEDITGTYITGKTIRTDVPGNDRMEFSGAGLISYGQNNQKNGISAEYIFGDFSSLKYYVFGALRGFLEYTTGRFTLGTAAGADIVLSPSGNAYIGFNSAPYEIATKGDLSGYATQTWVTNNFASDTHNHDNRYVRGDEDDFVKSRSSDDISIAVTDYGIVIRKDGVVMGSIFYD
ncbi:MAG TPA: hypothetical protein GXZ70_04045, partial [Clostridiales bacterium]|nr:hypothetical protein [Clostridiales bacterium]